ncbi:MAG: hypothetical protein HFF33_11225 [Oscillospiraceae bacterium]|nr:hypothetical protein [Oscillospiraceae bacterium]
MPEKCANDPTQTCRSATRLVLLEKRVEDLETGQTREEAFRKAYYAERENRIQREAQQAKPERLLDKLKENSFWLVLAAVLGAVLARVGL